MSEVEIRAYVIADNRLAEQAGWDRHLLGLELQYLSNLDIDLDTTLTGFCLPEIDSLIGDLSLAADTGKADPAGAVPDLPVAPPSRSQAMPGSSVSIG